MGNLLTNTLLGLSRRFDLRNIDVVLFEVALNVKGSSSFFPERLANSKNSRPLYFAALNPVTDQFCILQYRCNIKNGCKTPFGEHLLQLRIDFLRRLLFGMQQAR